MEFSPEFSAVLAAYCEARRLVVSPKKSRQNTHLKNHYATIDDVNKAIGPALEDNKLVVIQSPTHREGQAPNVLLMDTMIFHTPTGQWIKDTCQIPLPKSDCQGFGSALTYARRYAKVAIFDLNMNDDDGVKGTRTASDFKRDIMAATTNDEIDAIARLSVEAFKGDAASMAILRDAAVKRRTELKNSNSVDFKPAGPANAGKGEKQVVTIGRKGQDDPLLAENDKSSGAGAAPDLSDF